MDLLLSHYCAVISQYHDMPAKNVNKSESPQWPSHPLASTRRHLIISGGFEAIFLFREKKTVHLFCQIFNFPHFKSGISSADYADESPRRRGREKKNPRCYRFRRHGAQLSGFKDSCKQLNGISANLSMHRATVSRFRGGDGGGGGPHLAERRAAGTRGRNTC